MSHHIPWCGCDPNHLPTHSRGGMRGCKYEGDPKELLIRATETFVSNASLIGTKAEAIVLLKKWLELDG